MDIGAGLSGRNIVLAVGAAVMLSLAGCGGLSLLPQEPAPPPPAAPLDSYRAVEAAYDGIRPGVTRISDLGALGFDKTAGAERLSYLGVMDRLMPASGESFDRLAPAVRACVAAGDRCQAFLFHPGRVAVRHKGDLLLDFLGFRRVSVERGWSAEVTVLALDGRVAYKVLKGRPHIDDTHVEVRPLGPLQGVADGVMRVL